MHRYERNARSSTIREISKTQSTNPPQQEDLALLWSSQMPQVRLPSLLERDPEDPLVQRRKRSGFDPHFLEEVH